MIIITKVNLACLELKKSKYKKDGFKMKKIICLGLVVFMLFGLCACGAKTLDVTIDGGAETAKQAVQKYYDALSSLDYENLIIVSASLNKTCVQNTVANYDEEKYNSGIETMKAELEKDLAKVSIVATVGDETTYDSNSEQYKTFIKDYKKICAGIDKIQSLSKVKVTLTYKEDGNEFTEEIEQNCILIQNKWFVFDYSEDAANESDASDETEPTTVEIVGGGSSIEDVAKKYFKAISDKNATNMADVLVTMNKTALQAISGPVDDSEYQKGLDAMKTEMAADTDTAVLTPTVSDSKTYKSDSTEFAAFISKHADILVNTTQVKEYAEVTISLSIAVPGESETFSATEKLTCIKIDNAWFVMVTE
jgi:hypothetical protein